MTEVPAIRGEPYMPNRNAYHSQVIFRKGNGATWEEVGQDIWDRHPFSEVLKAVLKEKNTKVILGMTDPHQKIKAISNYIKQNIEWNGYEDFLCDEVRNVFDAAKDPSVILTLSCSEC